MPVYRGPDGKIIEEKTDKGEDVNRSTDRERRPMPPASPGGGQAPGSGRLDAPTQKMDVSESRSQSPLPPDEKTRIIGGRRGQTGQREMPERAEMDVGRSQPPLPTDEKTQVVGGQRGQAGQRDMPERAEKAAGMDDPVVGWLAVVEGPGKGNAMQLGYGANAVGRGDTARVNLDFGDDQISRGGHAIVTYDPRGRKFYVQHGGGTNLTYLNDQPVLIPIELPALSHISIGETVLRFVPLCGEEFDWQDAEEGAEQ